MSQLASYEFTYHLEDQNVSTPHDPSMFIRQLKEWAKKYVFQLERGDKGSYHYQGRMSLIKKRRPGTLKKALSTAFPRLHVSPTVVSNTGNFSYVMKADTRVEGPWRDGGVVKRLRRQHRVAELYPFQQEIIDRLDRWEPRIVNCLVDEKGCSGKSTLISNACMLDGVYRIFPLRDKKDFMRMVMNTIKDDETPKALMVDVPRAENVKTDFWIGLETVKDGFAYDDRYQFKTIEFDSPQVWVFTNTMPNWNLLTNDRWQFWMIVDKKLVPWKNDPSDPEK